MGRLDSHMDSQIELSKIFLTALLGFITIQNYIKNLLKRKERTKEKDIYIQRGKHERDQRTHARCRPGKFLEKKQIFKKS